MRSSTLTSVLFIATLATRALAVPPWAKETTGGLQGRIFRAACNGQGPSVSIARQEAISSCKASASQALQKETKIRSMSIETEKDVAFHQEVSDQATYSNLICHPEKESIEDVKDGLWTVWVLCRIDLDKVEVSQSATKEAGADQRSLQDEELLKVSSGKSLQKPSSNVTSDDYKFLNIVSVPPCSEILVKGQRARIQRCDSSPVKVLTYKSDEALVIRARGYMPKTIELKGKSWVNNEAVQVILENE